MSSQSFNLLIGKLDLVLESLDLRLRKLNISLCDVNLIQKSLDLGLLFLDILSLLLRVVQSIIQLLLEGVSLISRPLELQVDAVQLDLKTLGNPVRSVISLDLLKKGLLVLDELVLISLGVLESVEEVGDLLYLVVSFSLSFVLLIGKGSDLEGPVGDAVGEGSLGVSSGSFGLVEEGLEVFDFLIELDGFLGIDF